MQMPYLEWVEWGDESDAFTRQRLKSLKRGRRNLGVFQFEHIQFRGQRT